MDRSHYVETSAKPETIDKMKKLEKEVILCMADMAQEIYQDHTIKIDDGTTLDMRPYIFTSIAMDYIENVILTVKMINRDYHTTMMKMMDEIKERQETS